MSDRAHIIVVGAGVIGLSTADSLVQSGFDVTVYDAAPAAGRGASFANSGMIHPSQVRPWFADMPSNQRLRNLFEMASHSREMIDARLKSFGLFNAGQSNGSLQLFDSQCLGETALSLYKGLGIPVELYRGEWGFQRYALRFPDDQTADSYAYCQALADNLAVRGAKLRLGKRVELSKDGEKPIVICGKDRTEADHIIIAAGAASMKLLAPVNLALPVAPVVGHALNFFKTGHGSAANGDYARYNALGPDCF